MHHLPVEPDEAANEIALAFPQLTPMQCAFVVAYVASGGKRKQSAIDAGYAEGSAHVEAYRLLQKTAILQAVQHLSVRSFGALLPGAIRTVSDLSVNAKSEYVRLEASKDVLDRMGLTAPKRVQVDSNVSVTFDFGEGV